MRLTRSAVERPVAGRVDTSTPGPRVERTNSSWLSPASLDAPTPATQTAAPSWFARLLSACSKPMMAVSLGAQLLFGALPAGATQAAILGTWSPTTELAAPARATPPRAERLEARAHHDGPAARLRARAEPKLKVLRAEAAALREARQARPLAANAVEIGAQQLRSAEAVLREQVAALDTLDARLARAGEDPVERAIVLDERAGVVEQLTTQRALVAEVAGVLTAARTELTATDARLARAEARVEAATRALDPERARAEALIGERGVSLPWIMRDASIVLLGHEPPSSEVERVLTFATRLEAWVARTGELPSGAVRAQLALASSDGIDWALAALPRDVVVPATHIPFIARFDVERGVEAARTAYALLGRDLTRIDVRDAELFARHPSAEHGAFIALLDTLDGASGGLVGPLASFESLWPIASGEATRVGPAMDPVRLDRATLDAAVDAAREVSGGLSAELLPLWALGVNGHPHQRANVDWLRAHARFEGQPGEGALALGWAAYPRPERAALDTLAARLGRPLTVAEVAVLSTSPKAVDALAALGPGVALKDVHLMRGLAAAAREEPRLAGDRASLEAAVVAGLRAPAPRLDRTYTEDWAHAKDRLSDADLKKIMLVQRELERPEVRAALAEMIRLDRADPHAEFGGVVRLVEGRARFVAQDGRGGGNNAFIPGRAANPLDALFAFHFHALDPHGDPDAAGPSDGSSADLTSAYHLQLDGLVLTPIAPGRVNVDYFGTNGVVLDLGTFDVR